MAEPTTRIASVVECAPEDPAATECGPQDERSPAALAGLEPGDTLPIGTRAGARVEVVDGDLGTTAHDHVPTVTPVPTAG